MPLVEVDGAQREAHRRAPLQLAQEVEHRVAVLAAADARRGCGRRRRSSRSRRWRGPPRGRASSPTTRAWALPSSTRASTRGRRHQHRRPRRRSTRAPRTAAQDSGPWPVARLTRTRDARSMSEEREQAVSGGPLAWAQPLGRRRSGPAMSQCTHGVRRRTPSGRAPR